jgi:alcohol dehydrogenase class IV
MKFCAARKPGLYRRVGIACGLDVMRQSDKEADQATIQFIAGFLAEIGLNTRLGNHGVTREHLDRLVEQAFDDPCHKTNAVPVSRDDLRNLYLEVL